MTRAKQTMLRALGHAALSAALTSEHRSLRSALTQTARL